jgi:anti-sigma regulatory factor (Ser/Thr protein kinase)
MGSILVNRWLGEGPRLQLIDQASVAVVREWVRREGRAIGLSESVTGALVTVASELGHNQLAHAQDGEIMVRPVVRDGVAGLEVVAADRGHGIASPTKALQGASRAPEGHDAASKTSLGIGLAAVIELSDETDFDIRLREGTCVWARKFAEPLPRRREVGIYGRPYPGEETNGDDATFVRSDEGLLLGVADGLGHGELAREASAAAIETAGSYGADAVDAILMRCHGALGETRGAVMAVARVGEPGGAAAAACVGNVSVHVYGLGSARRFSGPSFVLGAAGRTPRVRVEEDTLDQHAAIVLFTDGLTTKADIEGEHDLLLRQHPIAIAHQLVERFGRSNDDVLVLVAR